MYRITSLSLSLSLPLKLLVLCDTFLYSTIRASDACSVIFLYPDRNDMTSPVLIATLRHWAPHVDIAPNAEDGYDSIC